MYSYDFPVFHYTSGPEIALKEVALSKKPNDLSFFFIINEGESKNNLFFIFLKMVKSIMNICTYVKDIQREKDTYTK